METVHKTFLPLSILVVDSHVDAADSLAEILSLCGYSVEVARTGKAALLAAPADVVLLELRLPDLDGCAVARQLLAANRADWRTVIVALTTRNSAADRRRAAEAGISDYLVKPSNPGLLLDLLSRFGQQAKETLGGKAY